MVADSVPLPPVAAPGVHFVNVPFEIIVWLCGVVVRPGEIVAVPFRLPHVCAAVTAVAVPPPSMIPAGATNANTKANPTIFRKFMEPPQP